MKLWKIPFPRDRAELGEIVVHADTESEAMVKVLAMVNREGASIFTQREKNCIQLSGIKEFTEAVIIYWGVDV